MQKVSDTAEKIRNRGRRKVEITCDVTDRSSLCMLRNKVIEAFDTVDILVTSAGAISRDSLIEISEEEWNNVIDIQLTGVYRSIQLFAREMTAGSIINISSIIPQVAAENLPAYSAAKGGVDALTRAAAKELAPDIRVNAISPGFVITPHNKETYRKGTEKRKKIQQRGLLDRVAKREEIAGAAIYLASDSASYVTGEVLTVDGGVANSIF
jgi:NAD(P)-dependent dehydrogenase (short-subunit alcohol dehydrogenase family)